jgi:serine/threonine protein phosphatase PrpC
MPQRPLNSARHLHMRQSVKDITLTIAACSDVGRVRSKNEDAYTVSDFASGARVEAASNNGVFETSDAGILLAISDGMGGHAAGEVASHLVLESVRAALPASSNQPLEQRLDLAVHQANRAVFEAAQAHGKHGMGATLTAVFICHDHAYIAEVGDSRAYLLRQGKLRQLTRDQSLVQLLVDGGMLTAEDAKRSPQRNVILQAMGLKPEVQVAIAKLLLRRGDKLLLCSDGISNPVTDDELTQIVQENTPAVACAHLIELANERGGEDNSTVIVAELAGQGLEHPGPPPTGTFQVVQQFGDLPQKSGAAPAARLPAGAAPLRVVQLPLERVSARPLIGQWLTSGSVARFAILLTALLLLIAGAVRLAVR